MKKPKLLLSFVATALFVSAAFAQTAKFYIVTYSAPAGWAVEKDAGSIRFTKEAGTNYCVLSLTKAVDSVGDSGKNFEILWKAMAVDGLNATATPERGKQGDKDGWQAEAAIAPFAKDGLKGAVILTTFTGNDKVLAVLAISNSVSFQKDIETFVDNVKLPPIASQKTPAAPVAANSADAEKLIGRWQRSGSSHPTYANAASWGTAGYTTSRYEFKADGTYVYTERTFRMLHPEIFVVRENGRYSRAGNALTVTPVKSTITAYKKAGGTDALGAVVTTQNRSLASVTYKFTFHYFEGIKEWNLVLQADAPTERDGKFSGNTTFQNAWYFDQKYTDKDLTAVRAN